MTATMQPTDRMTSAELTGLVDQAIRLANSAGRADLVDRLNRSRGRVAGRGMQVVVLGAPGQGATSLARVLSQSPIDRLPGANFLDAPGRNGSNQLRLPEPGSADVVLLVSDAGQEYTPWELDVMGRLRAQGTQVAGVLTKIDAFPRWSDVQRGNRRRLQSANLDSPSIPLLPVSAALAEAGRQRGDESLTVSSGVPQLQDFLADRVGTRVDPAAREAVLADIRAVTDQLSQAWSTELDTLQRAGNESPQERQQRAVAELERCQALSASWQIALNDGVTELVSGVDFDLRDRLREVMELAEKHISDKNPTGNWKKFDGWVRGEIDESVQASFQLARERSVQLSEQVAAKLAGNSDGSARGIALPRVRIDSPDEAMSMIKPMDSPEAGGLFARVINSLRGGYGGVLMVGVITSLAGLQLISVWSVGAGVLLGLFSFWEDHKNGKQRSKAEARMALSKVMDAVNFRVGDELRAQLRAVHRLLRDHFTDINDQRLRAASDGVRSAMEAVQRGGGNSAARLSELQNNVAELRQLRVQVSPGR